MQLTSVENSGTQRYILSQSKEDSNKRRRRRKSKERKKATLPTKDRVFHILATGKLKDFTHPSETDPYWDRLYRQYELLSYIEMLFRTAIRKVQRPLSDEEIIDVISTIEMISSFKNLLLRYMVNAMQPMYGSVMSKKFYGWYDHLEEFLSTFNETAVQTIRSLRFDPNRTRCSVYFYQVFWLTGITLKNEIGEEIYRYSYIETQDDRNEIWSEKTEPEENHNSPHNNHTHNTAVEGPSDDPATTIEEEIVQEHDDLINLAYAEIADDFTAGSSVQETQPLLQTQDNNTEPSDEITMLDVVNHILSQVGLSAEALSPKGVTELGAFLKKLLKQGRINVKGKYAQFLKEKGYKVP